MRKLLPVLLLFFCLPAVAQTNFDLNERPLFSGFGIENIGTSSLRVNGQLFRNSNGLSTYFVNQLTFGGFIDDDEKENELKRLSESNNRFGLDARFGIYYTQPFEKLFGMDNINLVVGVGSRDHVDLKYSKDLFSLIFNGNKQFAGETAELHPMQFRRFHAQSIYLGLEKNASDNLFIGGGLSLIQGSNYARIKSERGSLFTSQSGDSLALDIAYEMAFTEDQGNIFAFNGFGAAANFYLQYQFENGAAISFEVQDLGAIAWGGSLKSYSADSVFHFEGAEIDNLFDFTNDDFSQEFADSIESKFEIKPDEKGETYFIPATFQVDYRFPALTEKLSLNVGARYKLNAAFIPKVYARVFYKLPWQLIVAPTLAYGGYGNIDVELGINKLFGEKWILSVNAHFIESVILPQNSAGQGGYFSLIKLF